MDVPNLPTPLEYGSGSTARRPKRRLIMWVVAVTGFVCAGLMATKFVLQSLHRRESVLAHQHNLRSMCVPNLKNIAASLITYSETHQGKYPDTPEELLRSTGMTSAIFICPASNDVQDTGTPEHQIATLSAGGHDSYIYVGKGLTSSSPADTVVAYEPLSNHQFTGMNVLFNDYHVQFLDEKDGEKLIASITIGKPVVWPLRGRK